MTKQLITAALFGCLVWGASSSPAAADPIHIDVEVVPPHIEAYPRTVYEGRPVYYYEGHWYEQRGPRWVYYRDEPEPLVVYRSSPQYRHYHAPAVRHHHHDEDRPRHDRHHDDRRDDRHHHR